MRSERENGENETLQIPVLFALESRKCTAVWLFPGGYHYKLLSTLAQPDSLSDLT
jgi:hypothetical protein